MSDATDRYSAERRPEHSTIGDAFERFTRDKDAFMAGAQYALDLMTKRIDGVLMDPHTDTYLINCATDILTDVHTGSLG